MGIGLFIPCYIDAFFPEVGIATLELLERFGHEVVYPRDQTCCGQPMANSGFNAECADTEALFVRNFSGFDDKRQGDRGQSRGPPRFACRVPLSGTAAQCLNPGDHKTWLACASLCAIRQILINRRAVLETNDPKAAQQLLLTAPLCVPSSVARGT